MEEIIEKKINKLIYKAYILLAIGFIGILLVVRGEFTGEKEILYSIGSMIGISCAMFAGMICFYIVGIKEGIKIGK